MSEHVFMPEQRQLRGMLRSNYLISAILMGLLALIGSVILPLQAARVSVAEPRFWLALGAFAGLWFFALRALAAFGASRIGSADLYASAEGLRIEAGKAPGTLIPWESLGQPQATRLRPMFGPAQEGERLYLVPAPDLGANHRLAGLYLGAGWRPVIVISSRHADHTGLLARLGAQSAER